MKDLTDIIEKLTEIADYEGTEISETLAALIDVHSCMSELSDEFNEALEKEIIKWGKWADKCVKFVEYTETYTRTIKDIEIIGYF